MSCRPRRRQGLGEGMARRGGVCSRHGSARRRAKLNFDLPLPLLFLLNYVNITWIQKLPLFFKKEQSIRIYPIKDTPKKLFIDICELPNYSHLIKFGLREYFRLTKFGATDVFFTTRKTSHDSKILFSYIVACYFSSTPSSPPPHYPTSQFLARRHSRTPHGGSLILKRCPPPLSPPAADSHFPPSSRSLVGASSASVGLTVTTLCSARRRPDRHEAASKPISSFTRSGTVCSVCMPPRKRRSSHLHLASSPSTTSSR